MAVRVLIAVVIIVVAGGIAWWLEHRRKVAPPTQGRAVFPQQLDRRDFPRPEAPWLVALFTSSTCDSCEGLIDKARPLESEHVSVTEVEYTAHRALHERYKIEAAPITVLADADGVTRASFVGAFSATDLWNALAELRDQTETRTPGRSADEIP
jgi:hypothetical protein